MPATTERTVRGVLCFDGLWLAGAGTLAAVAYGLRAVLGIG